MASYRYERDINPKDLQPRKQRQYTRCRAALAVAAVILV